MKFGIDFNLGTVLELLVVALVAFSAKFMRKVDIRLTRIETILKLNKTEIE